MCRAIERKQVSTNSHRNVGIKSPFTGYMFLGAMSARMFMNSLGIIKEPFDILRGVTLICIISIFLFFF